MVLTISNLLDYFLNNLVNSIISIFKKCTKGWTGIGNGTDSNSVGFDGRRSGKIITGTDLGSGGGTTVLTSCGGIGL